MTPIKKTIPFGPRDLVLETGEIARQASGAVLASLGDTTVLATVVGSRTAQPGRDFFPLTVDYVEKTYAAGKIPGGFFKREGRPTEKETLTSRLIDRPLRPLFPDGFRNEVQVIATVLSLDPEIDPDIPALIGASAAVAVSGLPFDGPVGAARVGCVRGEFVLNPTFEQTAKSELDLVVAGTKSAVLMVESEAKGLRESVMLDAVMFGHERMQAAIDAIEALAAEAGKPRWEWTAPPAQCGARRCGPRGQAGSGIRGSVSDRRQASSAGPGWTKSAPRRSRRSPGRKRTAGTEAAVRGAFEQAREIDRARLESSPARTASTAADTAAQCATSPVASGSCPALTAPPCSRAARRRPSS